MQKEISYEYIRGLVEGEGCFTFSPNKISNSTIPAFSIRMHIRDKKLIGMVRDRLKLRNKIYEYYYPGNDGAKRGATITLIVREIGNIKNVIVPLFYKKLIGNKADSFEKWLDKIGSDPLVPSGYKFIYKLYVGGFYDNDHRFD
jgi:hypothetical protein